MKHTYIAMIIMGLVLMAGIKVLALDFMPGPAPNAGDGIPDGSGMETPIQSGTSGADTPGPAPNAGDGIPDGSGF